MRDARPGLALLGHPARDWRKGEEGELRKDAAKPAGRTTRHLLTVVTAYLKKRRLSRRRAATEVGLPEQTFRSPIKGHQPTLDRADKLGRALGITMTIGRPVGTSDDEPGDGNEEPKETNG